MFVRDRVDQIDVYAFALRRIAVDEAEVAKPVDQPRNATCKVVHAPACLRGKQVAVAAGVNQAVTDVMTGFVLVESRQVVIGADTLGELRECRRAQLVAQFTLPDQDNLQHQILARVEVGQHAQFLERRHGQVLRLVDDEQGVLAGSVALDDVIDETLVHRQAIPVVAGQRESRQDPLHQFAE